MDGMHAGAGRLSCGDTGDRLAGARRNRHAGAPKTGMPGARKTVMPPETVMPGLVPGPPFSWHTLATN